MKKQSIRDQQLDILLEAFIRECAYGLPWDGTALKTAAQKMDALQGFKWRDALEASGKRFDQQRQDYETAQRAKPLKQRILDYWEAGWA